jgi:ribosomal protein S18 acetylase RimI-like enzyme
MATCVEHRGCGLASALIDRALDLGRMRGFKQAQLSLFIGNLTARRTYERAGFRLVEEKRSAEFEHACGVQGLWCLGRPL